MLVINWRIYVAILLLAVGALGGWKLNSVLRPTPVVPAPVTNTVTVERVVTRTVTVTKNPDGTEITQTTETTADTSTSKSKPTTVPTLDRKWSIETIASLDTPRKLEVPKPKWSALLYHRLSSTNAWAGAGYDFGNKSVLLAVRIDF